MSEDPVSVAERVDSLVSALEKLPAYSGISFRGRLADMPLRRTGEVVVSRGLVPTSRDIRVATENFTASGLFAIVGRSGRAIAEFSRHPDEKEVVFLPSTMFLIVESWQAHGVHVTLVEELDPHRDGPAPKRPLESVRALVVKHVLLAQRRLDVTVQSPGKFVGDVD